ncbi:MAG: 3-oxoacyl-ACP reductase FabG [Bryobacterales bacterium]|nr:3-oxoacyl-ACP reductase FabG [Acidobacteriota bacterium]MCB9383215.1 3-oxoacyl-ACP reductase FabG [Bryobacterales bacterium]
MPSKTLLSNRVALVTGGSRGIGRAIALELAESGAAVGVNYHARPDAAEDVVARIREMGGRAAPLQADIADKAQVEAMFTRCESELGGVDILVNNAGLLYPGRLLDHQESEFDQMWRTNVKGLVYATEAAARGMVERGWGRIVNISSNAAIGTAMPGTTLYAATKGAVLSLTKRFAYELGEHGVTVNAVLPGFTKTDMVLADKDQKQADEVIARVAGRSMLGRVGEPEDIARVVRFLCTQDADFMTGQYLLADGGRMDYLTHC